MAPFSRIRLVLSNDEIFLAMLDVFTEDEVKQASTAAKRMKKIEWLEI